MRRRHRVARRHPLPCVISHYPMRLVGDGESVARDRDSFPCRGSRVSARGATNSWPNTPSFPDLRQPRDGRARSAPVRSAPPSRSSCWMTNPRCQHIHSAPRLSVLGHLQQNHLRTREFGHSRPSIFQYSAALALAASINELKVHRAKGTLPL